MTPPSPRLFGVSAAYGPLSPRGSGDLRTRRWRVGRGGRPFHGAGAGIHQRPRQEQAPLRPAGSATVQCAGPVNDRARGPPTKLGARPASTGRAGASPRLTRVTHGVHARREGWGLPRALADRAGQASSLGTYRLGLPTRKARGDTRWTRPRERCKALLCEGLGQDGEERQGCP